MKCIKEEGAWGLSGVSHTLDVDRPSRDYMLLLLLISVYLKTTEACNYSLLLLHDAGSLCAAVHTWKSGDSSESVPSALTWVPDLHGLSLYLLNPLTRKQRALILEKRREMYRHSQRFWFQIKIWVTWSWWVPRIFSVHYSPCSSGLGQQLLPLMSVEHAAPLYQRSEKHTCFLLTVWNCHTFCSFMKMRNAEEYTVTVSRNLFRIVLTMHRQSFLVVK